MSIHAQTSPEAQAALAAQKRNSTIASIAVGILLLALIGMIFWLISIKLFKTDTQLIVAYASEDPQETEPQKKKITTSVKKTPSASQSSAAVQIITATAQTDFSIPTPDTPIETLTADFGADDQFGDGWGGGFGGGLGGGGGSGASSIFGRMGGGGLAGTFYDMKQVESSGANNYKGSSIAGVYNSTKSISTRMPAMKKLMTPLGRSKFNKNAFSKYYRSEKELSFTSLVIDPNTSAEEGPSAFQAKVDPSGWCVVYEGKINPPTSGSSKVRFCGVFNDFIFVFINDRLVLNGANMEINQYGLPSSAIKSGAQLHPDYKLRQGSWVTIRNNTNIRIVVGESPGGKMGGGLFIEQQGEDYRSDGQGGKVLPPFTTEPLSDDTIKQLKSIKRYQSSSRFDIETENVPFFPATK